MIKQKDAVFGALQMASEQGLSGEQATLFAVEQVKNGFMAGEIEHRAGALDAKAASTYAGSLVRNWIKKDNRLNGGVKYEPSVKRGPQVKDETLKALAINLKSLKANNADPSLIARVEAAMEERRAQLTSEKTASKVKPLDEALAELEAMGIEVA